MYCANIKMIQMSPHSYRSLGSM